MKSKTLNIIKNCRRIISEQGEIPEDPSQLEGGDAEMGVTDVADPTPQQEVPLTSEGEEQYIKDLIDAALFEPSSDDAKTLTDLQGVMNTKSFTNAREEVLPIILNIIRPSTEGNDLRKELNSIQ